MLTPSFTFCFTPTSMHWPSTKSFNSKHHFCLGVDAVDKLTVDMVKKQNDWSYDWELCLFSNSHVTVSSGSLIKIMFVSLKPISITASTIYMAASGKCKFLFFQYLTLSSPQDSPLDLSPVSDGTQVLLPINLTPASDYKMLDLDLSPLSGHGNRMLSPIDLTPKSDYGMIAPDLSTRNSPIVRPISTDRGSPLLSHPASLSPIDISVSDGYTSQLFRD